MSRLDKTYYSRRVQQESTAAESASCAEARQVHLDLAKLYSARLNSSETGDAAPEQTTSYLAGLRVVSSQ